MQWNFNVNFNTKRWICFRWELFWLMKLGPLWNSCGIWYCTSVYSSLNGENSFPLLASSFSILTTTSQIDHYWHQHCKWSIFYFWQLVLYSSVWLFISFLKSWYLKIWSSYCLCPVDFCQQIKILISYCR